MRGDADLGISSSVAIGAAAQTVAMCQVIASIRQGGIEETPAGVPKPK